MTPKLRRAWPVVLGVTLIGVLFLAVFPTRTWLDQRSDRAAVTRRMKVLSSENRRLEKRVDRLHTDAEIERLAREQYNLVRPGEEAYALLPAPDPAPTAAHWWERAWAPLP
jgi:cell division protein FtsB